MRVPSQQPTFNPCQQRHDIKDATPITPNHFLLGRPCPNVAAAIFGGSDSPAQSSWRRSQGYLNSLWQLLLHEITPQMIGRPKWNKHDSQLKEEDLVWILNDNCPRGVLPLGIVEKTHTGPDGVVRSCLLKTALGKVTRPAVRLSLVHPKKHSSSELSPPPSPENVNDSLTRTHKLLFPKHFDFLC